MASSPPPAPTMPSPTTSPSPPRETVVDPRVVALRGMFPDYDDLILQSVLDSAGGNEDRAIDILLGMSDPDFQSEAPPQQPVPQAPVLSQTELDEQFARQLVLQEQQQETQNWLQNHPDARQQPPAVYRSSRPGAASTWSPQQAQQGQDRPSEFQEQFSKIAETGKKTFGNIFSKVKAKIQEFEAGRPAGQQASTSGANPAGQQPYQPQPQAWTPPHSQQASAAYFDPNSNRSTSPARTPPAAQGYDVSSPLPPSSSSYSPPLNPPPTSQQLQLQPQPQSNTIPPPPSTSQGAPIDAGKFGILPKRPISLIRDPNAGSLPPSSSASGAGAGAPAVGASAAPPARHLLDDDDDDDGLEYAENPFDDGNAGKK